MRIVYVTNTFSPTGAYCLSRLLNTAFRPILILNVSQLGNHRLIRLIHKRGVLFCVVKSLERIGMLIRAIFSKAGWHSSRPRSLLELTFAGKCQISNIRDINSPTTLALVSRVDVDVIISVCCPQILKPSVLKIPKYGCLNIHPGLLPQIRGADPTFWTWKLKNNYGGVTAHLMDEGIDTGPILVTGRFSVSPSDGEAEIRERALTLAPSVLLEAVKTLDLNKIPPSQEEGIFYPLPKRKPLKNLLGELKYLFRSLKETHDYEIFRANSRCIILDKDHGS